ncbi:tannase/feruloyl esterase family alpha/beta hydrolase [Novosphingobium sp.]|uniref:tannase/feruloyl esterase family alpha/beta hydrolase n=1 Tax=Novosphingobium sp. TaxID=1874826 RepID=UPI00333F7422
MLKHLLIAIVGLLGALGSGPALAQTGPAAGLAALAALAPVSPVVSCASLATVDLSGAVGSPTTQVASEVAGDHSYCQVTGTIARDIHFEVRLPLTGWTQRFLQTGCGGLCGNLQIHTDNDEGCTPVTDGSIVLASDDMGHHGMGGGWGADAAQRIDFAYRGNHATTLAAKALIRAFYGQPQRYAYFSGCSDGGREALIAAQRYPADFDGIAAGAPALNFTVQNSFHHGWLARVNTGADGHAILSAIDIKPLHTAVLAACDGADGLVDGQITDPRTCHFDPVVLACKSDYRPGECLTAPQIAAVRAIYDGARSPSGKRLEVGPLQPGSEMEWIGVFVPREKTGRIGSEGMALDTINNLLFTPNRSYTIASFPFTEDMLASEEPARALYSADNPDLGAFAGHGGKLILYHGWSDPHISPLNTIDYYERVGRKMGSTTRDGFVRMFLLPGMGHCGGGDGPSAFPLLAGLMAWVQGGTAPAVFVAHRTTPKPMGPPPGPASAHDGPPPEMIAGMRAHAAELAQLGPRSRPVFAYPAIAQYAGSGPVDDAASFRAVTPAPVNGISDWAGARP